ncbi:MAG: hypothetical protein IJ088_05625 [Clostridia bacterium]|nr:hypothetical protein [Clostridia bacterium]
MFFIYDYDEHPIEEVEATSVGINEEGRLLIECDRQEYEIGKEDAVFLSREDAERYVADPDSIPDDYGIVKYRKSDLPYHPGMYFYYCDYDGFGRKWDIFEEYYTEVRFDKDGSIRVGDGESECTVAGERVDPCFETLREARAYVKSHRFP